MTDDARELAALVEANGKAIAQLFAEPTVLKEWALSVMDRLRALEKRVGELENRSHVHASFGPVPQVLPDDD